MNHFSVFMVIEVFVVTDLINFFWCYSFFRVRGYCKKYTHIAILKIPEQMRNLEEKLGFFTKCHLLLSATNNANYLEDESVNIA